MTDDVTKLLEQCTALYDEYAKPGYGRDAIRPIRANRLAMMSPALCDALREAQAQVKKLQHSLDYSGAYVLTLEKQKDHLRTQLDKVREKMTCGKDGSVSCVACGEIHEVPCGPSNRQCFYAPCGICPNCKLYKETAA